MWKCEFSTLLEIFRLIPTSKSITAFSHSNISRECDLIAGFDKFCRHIRTSILMEHQPVALGGIHGKDHITSKGNLSIVRISMMFGIFQIIMSYYMITSTGNKPTRKTVCSIRWSVAHVYSVIKCVLSGQCDIVYGTQCCSPLIQVCHSV